MFGSGRRAVSLAAARSIRRPAVSRRSRGESRLPLAVASLLGVVLLVVSGGLGALGVTAIATVGSLSSELPDPARLADLTFVRPTIVYDRTGQVQLGRFEREQRRVVTYDQVPKTVLDATTTAEDRTFWTNDGFDPAAILAAIADNASGASDRGASTITQQLVRAPPARRRRPPGANRHLRKAKELIAAAARICFGVTDLEETRRTAADGAGLTRDFATTLDQASATMDVSILGSQPFASVAAGFRRTAEQSRALADELDAGATVIVPLGDPGGEVPIDSVIA